MQPANQTAFDFKVDAPSPIEMFRLRAMTVAARISNHLLAGKASAIDGLWRFAEGHGLVAKLGVDAVRALLAEAFDKC
jgi:hypothetical protein